LQGTNKCIIIFAKKDFMNLAFCKILRKYFFKILPLIHRLMNNQFLKEVLIECFTEMFDQNYKFRRVYNQK